MEQPKTIEEVNLKEVVDAKEQLNQQKEIVDPVEQAAFIINEAHKNFRKLVYQVTKRKKQAASRVLEAVLFEPLEAVELIGKEEQELFDICQQVMHNKGIVLNYAFERMKDIKKGEINVNEEK